MGSLLSCVIAFIIKNSDKVTINFVFFTAHDVADLADHLLLAIGFLGGVLLSQLYRRRQALRRRGAEHGGADG